MEAETNLKPKAKAETVGTSNVVGLNTPFAAKDVVIDLPNGDVASKIEGVDPETLLFQGVHPESKERMAVTWEGLQAEFGKELGAKKYRAISGVGGGSVFFNPKFEATTYHPPLSISGLNTSLEDLTEQFGPEEGPKKFEAFQKHAAKVASILASKE